MAFLGLAEVCKAYTFVNWTSDMTTSLTANISAFITDISPLLIPVIAIGLGLIIISAIVSAIRGH